jgi:hypothetical protein
VKKLLTCFAIAALAACSSSHKSKAGPSAEATSSSPAATATATTSSAAPNPVDILRKTGLTVPSGAGTDRGNGEKHAAGQQSGEQIDVTTYPSNAERTASADVPNASDDAHWYITVDRALVTVTGVEDATAHAVVFPLPAQTIATRIGGHLIPRA